jgi:hypothetical protein
MSPRRDNPVLSPAAMWLADLAVFAIAVAVCLHYGRLGWDGDSPVFDGGWRIYSGDVPYRDYIAVFGVTPGIMQAGFFLLTGVTHFSLVLHAALINGLMAVLTAALLRRLGAGRLVAALMGGLTGFVFYAPRAVAFLETHAFFFCMLALYGQVVLRRAAPRLIVPGSMAVGVALTLAYLSKPSPTVFFLGLVGWCWLVAPRGRGVAAVALLAGIAAAMAVPLTLAVTGPFGLEEFSYYLWTLPGRIAAERGAVYHDAFKFISAVLGGQRRLSFGGVVYLTHALFLAIVIVRIARCGLRTALFGDGPAFAALLGEGMLLINQVFSQLSHNVTLGNAQLVFVALGCQLAALTRHAEDEGLAARRGLLPVLAALCLFAVERADWYRYEVLGKRAIYPSSIDVQAPRSHVETPGLSWVWWLPNPHVCSATEVDEIVGYLRARPENFAGEICLGSGIWGHGYAHTGKPSVLPVPGYAPRRGDAEYPGYRDRVLAALDRHDVRLVVAAPETEILGEMLAELPVGDRCGEIQVGRHRIVEVCPSAWRRLMTHHPLRGGPSHE